MNIDIDTEEVMPILLHQLKKLVGVDSKVKMRADNFWNMWQCVIIIHSIHRLEELKTTHRSCYTILKWNDTLRTEPFFCWTKLRQLFNP